MTLKEQLTADMKAAMKEKAQQKLTAIRLIMAAIKQKEVDERVTVTDGDILQILDKMGKQRRESIQQYRQASREDLVQQEQFELDLIQTYLPTQLTDSEIDTLVVDTIKTTGATSIKDMGKVMGVLKSAVQGRADMTSVSAKIKEKLASC